MKQIFRTTSLLIVLIAVRSAHVNVLAQSQPVFLHLKGIGVGSDVTGSATDVQVVGDYAYLAGGGGTNHLAGFEIFSTTNLSVPVRVGGYESRTQANAILVAGHFAYLAEGKAQSFTNDPGAFEIVDISDPANPVHVGGIATMGRANGVRVSGSHAYVAESTRWTGSNLLGTLEIFDLSTATDPIRVANFDTAGSIDSFDVVGGYAYLADGVMDLQVVDVSDPANPRRVGVYNSDIAHNSCGFEPGGRANFVQVLGNLAFSAGNNGLHVLDVSDPAHPASIGDNFCFPIESLHVSGHYAYAAIYHSLANSFFFYVLDTSDPANLVVVGLKENLGLRRIQVAGNLLYFATNPLRVYELSDRPMINSIAHTGGALTLTWDYAQGFVLQRTTSPDNQLWSDVPGAAGQNRIELPLTSGNEFFRLARP
jgi:hypothetical protein